MQKAYDGELELIGSDILEIEISKIGNREKKNDVEGVYNALVVDVIKLTKEIEERAIKIRNISNIKAFDSLHLASAEIGADVLLTTDSKFLKGSQRIHPNILIKNPIEFVMEVFSYDDTNN